MEMSVKELNVMFGIFVGVAEGSDEEIIDGGTFCVETFGYLGY